MKGIKLDQYFIAFAFTQQLKYANELNKKMIELYFEM